MDKWVRISSIRFSRLPICRLMTDYIDYLPLSIGTNSRVRVRNLDAPGTASILLASAGWKPAILQKSDAYPNSRMSHSRNVGFQISFAAPPDALRWPLKPLDEDTLSALCQPDSVGRLALRYRRSSWPSAP
jgi:hypothetical protein